MRAIPWSLVLLRLLLAPVILMLARTGTAGYVLALIVCVALLSDIYDGVIARKLGIDTAAVRIADSLVDTVFYLAVLGALWLRVPDALRSYWVLLALLLAFEAARYGYDLRKFGRMASYHSYLAKFWGLVMAVSIMIVFTTGRFTWLLALSMVVGILNNVEGLAFSLVLPSWHRDVKSLRSALALRRAESSLTAQVR